MNTSSDLITIAERARAIVTTLATRYASRNGLNHRVLEGAAAYVREQMGSVGVPVHMQTYRAYGGNVQNIEVRYPGAEPDLPAIIVGAHYDTVQDTPGADDNASGIAGLIELVRLMKGYQLRHELRFIAFPHEEPPYFFSREMGSRVYADGLRHEGGSVMVMFSLEMIGYGDPSLPQTYPLPLLRRLGGYPVEGNFVALVGNLKSRAMVRRVRESMRGVCRIGVESIVVPGFLPPFNLSDHSSFWKNGYRAIMVTDTAFQRNPHYHSASDTPDTLNYTFLAEIVTGMYEAILMLDRS
jgi:Zn-dependent M28 family amino/carboxypeptidase